MIYQISGEQTIAIRQYERSLLRVVQVTDNFQTERIKRILQKLTELLKNGMRYFIVVDALTEITVKLSLRCPKFNEIIMSSSPDLIRLIQRFFKDFTTLPIGNSKSTRCFKEGQGLRYSDIKSTFLNQQSKFLSFLICLELDWIAFYIKTRTDRLVSHVQKTPDQQA